MNRVSYFLALWAVMAATAANAFVVLHHPLSTTAAAAAPSASALHLNLVNMVKHFGKKVKVSHVLIGPASSKTGRGLEQDAAIAKLIELKEEIGDDPEKFAAAATEHSSCRASMDKGGDLGEFGPGLMMDAIDEACFEKPVGVVHGPISTPYGEHLVLVREMTG